MTDELIERKIVRRTYRQKHNTKAGEVEYDLKRYGDNAETSFYFKEEILGEAEVPRNINFQRTKVFGQLVYNLLRKTDSYTIETEELTDEEFAQLELEEDIKNLKEERTYEV